MVTQAVLTGAAAKELGRTLRFIREARQMSLREVMKQTGVSYQYLQNIERGERTTVTVTVYQRLQKVYGLPDNALDDFILKARVVSALGERGVTPQHATALWTVVETQLNSLRYPVSTNLAELIAGVLSS
jgi:transcriptional regulator with XRE-family HTH domain